MEFADGDLYGHLKKLKSTGQSLTEQQVVNLFVQTSLAIKYMHDRKLLHRDIKTQNVFLTKSHVIKLGDLYQHGAQVHHGNGEDSLRYPCYFSLSSAKACPITRVTYGHWVLLYELCANRLPFESRI